ncbi:dCTP deaminase domain-containing protein [Kitasatospora purpeofusca]|uniref:dCTP deaminase n=1 Tax=Kitasatospora purpeofusca TaxID=67352 RepID=UPI002A5ACB60|nr:deoxycytidine deaminase [Kitasatospora purpeofusca]MDY0810503.1 deoxycytidine deaminase [Kitasatospora purpeofusca]
MTILTGPEIVRRVREGLITIEPFNPGHVNPNSYNYLLGPTLCVHRTHAIDAHTDHPLDEVTIPDGGIVLEPGRVYLGTTVETVGSGNVVPHLIGRSSMGRLGVFVEFSAEMGNLGAVHRWTLEIEAVQRTRVYAGDRVGQIFFCEAQGEVREYDGHFGRINDATAPLPELLAASR